jgi:membrane-bound lytic murein transglycosylase A
MVAKTISTTSPTTTAASIKIQFMLYSLFRHALRCRVQTLIAYIALSLAACTTVPPGPPPGKPPSAEPVALLPLQPVAWNALPDWPEDAVAQAWAALRQSCLALEKQSAWQAACAAAAAVEGLGDDAVRAYFELHFTPYALRRSDHRSGLVTGYYEPLLRGSRTPGKKYRFPLYAPPDDLLTIELGDVYPELKNMRLRGRIDGRRVLPYWSRADIDGGRAPLAGKELVWVDDAVEAFFLEIQGSGRIKFDDGSMIRVSYADQNGYPFRSIGRLLVERGELPLERASMQGIKNWGRQNPDKLPALLEDNPSYVFFRELPLPASGPDGPPGALGVALTAGRSIAVDARFVPLGAPVFLATTWPNSTRPLNRLMFAQDTGGAIRGPLRADFFWGFGDEAASQAGKMKQVTEMWLLWPKDAPPPVLDATTAKPPPG